MIACMTLMEKPKRRKSGQDVLNAKARVGYISDALQQHARLPLLSLSFIAVAFLLPPSHGRGIVFFVSAQTMCCLCWRHGFRPATPGTLAALFRKRAHLSVPKRFTAN